MGNPKNLEKWHEDNPGRQQALKHGGYSKTVKAEYSDGRTTKAKNLNRIMDALVADFGGKENLSASQNLLLGNVRSKLIVIMQINTYAERHENLIDNEGNLIGALGRSFLAYTEGLRRDLEALSRMGKVKGPATYDRAMKALEGTGK